MTPNESERIERDHEEMTSKDLQPTVIGAVSRPATNDEGELEVLTGTVIGTYTDNMGGSGQRLPPP